MHYLEEYWAVVDERKHAGKVSVHFKEKSIPALTSLSQRTSLNTRLRPIHEAASERE